MDTSESSSKSKSVMAPSNVAPSVIVALHPLVIMNISEHWTRVRAQSGKPTRGLLLFLAILGNKIHFSRYFSCSF